MLAKVYLCVTCSRRKTLSPLDRRYVVLSKLRAYVHTLFLFHRVYKVPRLLAYEIKIL